MGFYKFNLRFFINNNQLIIYLQPIYILPTLPNLLITLSFSTLPITYPP
jgi:hypothetical protein